MEFVKQTQNYGGASSQNRNLNMQTHNWEYVNIHNEVTIENERILCFENVLLMKALYYVEQ